MTVADPPIRSRTIPIRVAANTRHHTTPTHRRLAASPRHGSHPTKPRISRYSVRWRGAAPLTVIEPKGVAAPLAPPPRRGARAAGGQAAAAASSASGAMDTDEAAFQPIGGDSLLTIYRKQQADARARDAAATAAPTSAPSRKTNGPPDFT